MCLHFDQIRPCHRCLKLAFFGLYPGGGGEEGRWGVGGSPLCDLNEDVQSDRVWSSGCFVLNGVYISSFSVLNRVSLHYLMA